MRKVTLFIAMSLDGYIADKNGSVDWLSGQDKDAENTDTYSAFIKNIDTVVMGWNTYHQVTTELSPNEWVYQGLSTYVITHRKADSSEEIHFTQEDPVTLIKRLRSQEGKNIWICGGSNIIHQCMQNDLIDEYQISIIPTILGEGIPLFYNTEKQLKLRLVDTKNYNGIVDVAYVRAQDEQND